MLTPTQREHLEMIRSTTGGVLRPREVLADAKNPNSPLHGLFLWNDAEAASAYRLQQAKDICRVVVRMSASAPREAVRAVVRTGGPAASAPEPKTISDEDRYIATAIAAARAYVQAEEAQRAVCFWATKVADDGPIASTSYAIDAFIRGIPARCIVDVAAGMGSAGDAEWTEDRVAQIVSQYRLSRPVGWIERQASDEWIEDEDFEESTVYGLPLYAPPVVNHFPGQGRDHGGSLRRFEMKPRETIQDKEAASLNADHSALTEARTLFPTRVFDSADADHVLVSGHNNAKIGAFVTKGPWAGMSIYTLTMEERATCPDTCHLWAECMGNAMPLAKRWKYDDTLINKLHDELLEKSREHPAGFIVRLHVLGDFPDIGYVNQWGEWLGKYDNLHVFGYTAHGRYSIVGQEIADLNKDFPNRWAIRFSVAPDEDPQPMQATTIWHKARGSIPEGVVCPASSEDTEACGTCGLCWNPAFADKRVVFLGHGMNRTKGGRTPDVAPDIAIAMQTPETVPNQVEIGTLSVKVAPMEWGPALEYCRENKISTPPDKKKGDLVTEINALRAKHHLPLWEIIENNGGKIIRGRLPEIAE